jgi:hypothetical protein
MSQSVRCAYQVVQNHHARVLGTSQLVKLVVVALAQRQERLAGVKMLTFYFVIRIDLRIECGMVSI